MEERDYRRIKQLSRCGLLGLNDASKCIESEEGWVDGCACAGHRMI
jgi:hypothetical protein